MNPADPVAWHDHAQRLADELQRNGVLTDLAWREAILHVPRHVFIPDFYLHTNNVDEDERTGTRLTSATPGYLAAAYSDDTLVTQYIERDGWPWATSSSTAPSLMLRMLHHLDVREGMTVLEIGTGTGYNAGLLSQRLGDSHVTSIDIDPDLVHLAGQRLKAAGFRPTLAVGDGRGAFPEAAPYDRLIATVAFDQVPSTWIQQVNPGGVIVCDLRPAGAPWAGAMAKLTVAEDHTATGRLLECRAGFMPARTQATLPGSPDGVAIDKTTIRNRETSLGGDIVMTPDLALIIWQRVPKLIVYPGADKTMVIAEDSWAEVTNHGPGKLNYGGPVDIWADVEDAYAWWQGLGQPGIDRYGITVTPDRKWIWVDTTDQPLITPE